jgi:hypothetical protein
MIQQNFNLNFMQQTTTQKGTYAESIVDKKLEALGWIVYEPIQKKAHAFDRLCIKDKKICMIAEVKAKAKRKFFPDTGIDYRHYETYREMYKNHNLDTYLFFVDEEAGKIYGNYLSKLIIPNHYSYNGKEYSYPRVEEKNGFKIIYFYINEMEDIAFLDSEEQQFLKSKTTKNSIYCSIK